ncbi:MAG TPA: AMP-binding protein [Phycisphaerae bacterium]|nr:AMP-binding protein [Phycisphaerae bacterium]
MPIFDAKNETLSREILGQVQIERLQAVLNRVQRNVSWYRRQLKEAGIGPGDVRSLDDLLRLPMTTGEALAEGYPYSMFAVPLREVIRLHSVPGPGGRMLVIGHTRNDVRQWARLAARTLAAAGVSETDVVQICFGEGFFVEAMGFQYGAELLGASVIPAPVHGIDEQIQVVRDYRATVLVSTPTHARQLVHGLRERGIEPQSLHLRTCVLSRAMPGEPWRESLEEGLFAKVFTSFGIPEVVAPGIAAECRHTEGMHVNEDHVIVELIDPESDQPVPDGHRGELVVTSLTREGFPLLRYRTGYLTSMWRCPCPCGRTGALLQPILGWTDSRLLVNEVPVYPAEVERILSEVEHATPHFRLNLRTDETGETLEVQVGVDEKMFADKVRSLDLIRSQIMSALSARWGTHVDVRLVEVGTLKEPPPAR